MMCISRAVQREPITGEFCLALLDGVIIPALRAGRDAHTIAPVRCRDDRGESR